MVPLIKKATTKSGILKEPIVKSTAKALVKPRASLPSISKIEKTSDSSLPKARPNVGVKEFKFPVEKSNPFDTKLIDSEVFVRGANSPSHMEFSVEPAEGDNVFFHPTPGFTSEEKPMGLVAVRVDLYNKGAEMVVLEKLVLECIRGNSTIVKQQFTPATELKIEAGKWSYWQNSRDYDKNGEVISLEPPFANKLKLSLYFRDFSSPLTVTKNLIPYPHALALPFDKADFADEEYVTGASLHSSSGGQIFGYDLGVNAYYNKTWSHLLPNTDGSQNEHFRIYGKPVRAMADGIVLHSENNMPNNPRPDKEKGDKEIRDKLLEGFDYSVAGNHFYIRHGSVVALYAHFQKGSLTTSLMKKGTVVKKGTVLGKSGNSGNSSHPHLHLHLKVYKNDDAPDKGFYRSLLFNSGYVIGTDHYRTPRSNVHWSKLQNQGIPGVEGKNCFVAMEHPYCEYKKNGVEIGRHGISEADYQTEFDKIWTCGYYPVWVNGFDVNGKTYFNAVFRPSKNIDWVARHHMDGKKYQTEFDTWVKAGYRLININSYLLNGKLKYAAVWKKDNSVQWMAYHGQSLSWHEANFEKNLKAGWVPTNVSCVNMGSKTYVTALWEKKNTGGFYLRPDMDLQAFKDAFKDYTDTKKFKLVYLDAYVKGGKPRLSGIWYKNAPDYNSWWEKHHLSSSQYQREYTNMFSKGYLTRCVVGYEEGRNAKYEGIWSK